MTVSSSIRHRRGLLTLASAFGVLVSMCVVLYAGAYGSSALAEASQDNGEAALAQTHTASLVAASTPQLVGKAMWVWTWTSNADVVRFAQAHGVDEVFAYARPGFSQTGERATLADLSAQASAAGIRLWAMGGDPSWVDKGTCTVGKCIPSTGQTWVREVRASKLFSGVHVELEPHQLSGFFSDPDPFTRTYLSVLSRMHAAAGPLPMDVSLPWWYHTLQVGKQTLTHKVIERCDEVTIVTFNNTVAGVEYDAADAAADATSQKVPFRFASETNNVPDSPEWLSFYGHSAAELLSVEEQVSANWKSSEYFDGFAVHDYAGWSAMSGD